MSIIGRKAERGKKRQCLIKTLLWQCGFESGNNSSMEQLLLCLAVEWDCQTEMLSDSAVLLKNCLMAKAKGLLSYKPLTSSHNWIRNGLSWASPCKCLAIINTQDGTELESRGKGDVKAVWSVVFCLNNKGNL